MVEDYIGEEVFKKGVQKYLRGHLFGNAVSDDLWMALGNESGKYTR